MSKTIQSFSALTGSQPKVLVLGSIPGVASLNAHQYYAHPRNAFWPIMCDFFNIEKTLSYEQRLALLLSQKVALWDVLAQAERKGSLDSAIKVHSEKPNPIDAFVVEHSSLTTILLNGGKAESSFKKAFARNREVNALSILKMPSTSPAYAAMNVDDKKRHWHRALSEAFN